MDVFAQIGKALQEVNAVRTQAAKPAQRTVHPIRFRTCQFMESEPRADDACKCNAPVVDGVYCQKHLIRCYPKKGRQDLGKKSRSRDRTPRHETG